MHITLICADDELWSSGMRIISSVLREAGHETTMIFAGSTRTPLDQDAMQRIVELVADSAIIGISSMSRGSARAKQIIGGLRPLERLIVWGGIHPTLFPEDCAAHADLICRGEGEGFMLDLAERVASGKDYADIPNGGYLSNGRTVLNGLRPPIPDLDALPHPDYAFENEYVLDRTGAVVPNTMMKSKTGIRGMVLFSGSRGCMNNCTYCSNSKLKSIYRGRGDYVRKMSVPRFIEGAGEALRLFPQASYFYFTDEDFFARPVEELREFADTYPEKVGLPFQCMASPRQITEEKVALAVKAGMIHINMGLESGSERVRHEVFHRHVTDEMQIQASLAISNNAQAGAMYYLIIGNPYEGRQDLLDGVRFLERLPPPFYLGTYNLVFLPGTKLYDMAVADGIIGGMGDSASDLDFLAGFDHRTHEWKRKNLYLNSLLSLMGGRSRRRRIGLVPRAMIPLLCAPRLVDFCDRHAVIGELLAVLGFVPNFPRRDRTDW